MLSDAIERVAQLREAALRRMADAQGHAKRNHDSRNRDRAAHWQDVADEASVDADALLEVIEAAQRSAPPAI